ncbi:MAG: S-layer homology domain-containing protein [Monoglobaceae bacterium]
MKKILCWLLTMMLFCVEAPCMAEEGVPKTAADKALSFLSVIGMQAEGVSEAVQFEKEITRAEFASNVSRLINDNSVCEKLYYHDVSRDDWFFNAVGTLTERGLFSGNGNGEFNPGEVVTTDQAIKVLVTLLGYGPYAELEGGYPTGYMKAARRLKLSDGCSSSDTLTLGDMYIMFENALKTNIASGYVSEGEYHFLENTADTLLGAYHGLYYETGLLTGCDGVDIKNGSEIDDGKVVIDDAYYESDLKNLLDLIGEEVEFVYSKNEGQNSVGEIKWLQSRNVTDCFVSGTEYNKIFNPDTYELSCETENSDKNKTLRISKGVKIIFNNEYAGDEIKDMLSLPRYSLRLVRSSSGGEYDIAVVWAYENITVGSKDSTDEVVYDKFDSSRNISLDSSKYDSLKIVSGNSTAEFSDIEEGAVLSCFKSRTGKRLKVVVSENKKTGVIESIKTDNGETGVTVGGSTFVFYDKNMSNSLKAGDKITVYMDFNGYAASAEAEDDREFPAYIINATLNSGGFDDCLMLKIIDGSGAVNIYLCADNVTADGIKFCDMDLLYKHLLTSEGRPQQLAVFTVNDEKKIMTIDTAKLGNEDADKSLRLYSACDNQRYSSVGKLGTKILIDNDTKIFVESVPGSTDENDFMIKGKSDLINSRYYSAEAYRYKGEALDFEDILVVKDRSLGLPVDSSPCILVDSIGQCLNDDGDTVECVIGYQGGAELEISAATDSLFTEKGVSGGDVIRLIYDKSGNASDVEKLYDYDSGKRPYTNSGNGISYIDAAEGEASLVSQVGAAWANTFRMVTVYASNTVNNVLCAGYSSGESADEMFNLSGAAILIYDSEAKEKIRTGTMADIRTFKTSGDNCSTVFIHTYATNIKTVVVYR